MNDDLDEEEKFSENREEQLKIENDILKLKLQAELGADFTGEEELSPDLENIFLKNVLEFEHQFANAASKTIFEILGSPEFSNVADLSDEEVEDSLSTLEALLEEKGIVVDYGEDYEKRTKYKFVTEELFLKESTLVNIPGMTTHFIYEEFHPNHELEIKDNAEKFFKHWIDRSFEENSLELAPEMILENGNKLPVASVLQKMQWMFEAYVRFENTSFTIENTSVDLPKEGRGPGFAEGVVSYDAVLESGEIQRFSGPFKLYMQHESWWQIFYFQWPGFQWD